MSDKNNHRGDTLPKRVARVEFYLRIRAHVGEERFRQMRFCYLASFEGGDAAVLRSLGVDDELQLAVDFDGASLNQFSEKYPNIPVYRGNVGNLPPSFRFDCMFLDLCANISEKTIDTIADATSSLDRGNDRFFGVAILRAREQGWKSRIEASREMLLKHHPARDVAEREAGFRRLHDGRSLLIYNAAQNRLMKRKVGLLTVSRMTYRGVDPVELSDGKPGSPMLVMCWRTECAARELSSIAFSRRMATLTRENVEFHAIVDDWYMRFLAGETLPETRSNAPRPQSHLERLTERLARCARLGGCACDFVGYEDNALMAAMISTLDAEGVRDVALALNMKPSDVAAVRAHATRGTYARIQTHRLAEQLRSGMRAGIGPNLVDVVEATDSPEEDALNAVASLLGISVLDVKSRLAAAGWES